MWLKCFPFVCLGFFKCIGLVPFNLSASKDEEEITRSSNSHDLRSFTVRSTNCNGQPGEEELADLIQG